MWGRPSRIMTTIAQSRHWFPQRPRLIRSRLRGRSLFCIIERCPLLAPRPISIYGCCLSDAPSPSSTLGPKGRRTGDRHRIKSKLLKARFWHWHANSPRAVNSGLVAETGGPIVTTGYNTSLAIKVGYYVLAAGVAVFVGMLLLTAYP